MAVGGQRAVSVITPVTSGEGGLLCAAPGSFYVQQFWMSVVRRVSARPPPLKSCGSGQQQRIPWSWEARVSVDVTRFCCCSEIKATD